MASRCGLRIFVRPTFTGVTHGWHQRQIVKFFVRLEARGQQQLWIEWLKRFQHKLLPTPPEYKRQIGTLMMSFGKLADSTPEVGQFGTVASQIGRELLFDNYREVVWEYDGADLVELTPDDPDRDNVTTNTESENLPQSTTKSASSLEQSSSVDGDRSTGERVTENRKLVFQPNSDPLAVTGEETSLSTYPEPENGLATETVANTAQSELSDVSLQDDPISDPVGAVESEVTVIQHSLQPKVAVTTSQTGKTEDNYSTKNNHFSSIELVKNWFELGIRQAISGNFDKAIASWDCALELNPNLPEAWHNRGSALGHLGKYAEAVASFERALVMDANNYQTWNGHAHALYLLEKWFEAASSWQKAIEIVPDNYLFWFNRARALERIKSFEESLVSYQKALEIKPDFQAARSRYLSLVRENSGTN